MDDLVERVDGVLDQVGEAVDAPGGVLELEELRQHRVVLTRKGGGRAQQQQRRKQHQEGGHVDVFGKLNFCSSDVGNRVLQAPFFSRHAL